MHFTYEIHLSTDSYIYFEYKFTSTSYDPFQVVKHEKHAFVYSLK